MTSLRDPSNIAVVDIQPIPTPQEFIEKLPLDDKTNLFIQTQRSDISEILQKNDPRFLAIVGPCSIHNIQEAKQYAHELKKIAQEVSDRVLVIMRTYFEKPRTTVGWKGLVYDPDLNGGDHIEKGLEKARELLLYINRDVGLPVAVEYLDTLTPQYFGDLVSRGAIGARTTESQIHRQLASGLSIPVGFKNGTQGDIKIAMDAIESSSAPHSFLGADKNGRIARVKTMGNPDGHIILRGGLTPNYSQEHIEATAQALQKRNIHTGMVVDVSHGNSSKNYANQPKVLENLCEQIANGQENIVGVMVESHIHEGSQKFEIGVDNPLDLQPGVSITDACVSLETTKNMLLSLHKAVGERDKTKIK